MPLSASARRELLRFLTERTDYLPEIPDAEKLAALDRISYQDFLTQRAGLSAEAAQFFQRFPQSMWGVGTDATSTRSGVMFGMPGLRGLGGFGAEMERAFADLSDGMMPGAIFADGNASIARLLTRELVPSLAPGRGMENIVPARFDYAQLDRADAAVRIRLSSIAVHVDPLANDAGVEVTYLRGGKDYRVRARNCVLAGYHSMIPSLCPTLPETQKQALRYGEKTPLMSSNVLLRSGRFLQRSGVGAFYAPGRMHAQGWALGRCMGRYQSGWNPDDAMVLQLFGSTIDGPLGASMREQYRAGRRRMLAMSFEDFEREIRIHLGGMLGGAGFDPARDILAITVNRWPHGYAYEHNSLFDPDWPEGQAPNEIGRRRFGRIAIANSDAAWSAYVDGAIDQAHRAVGELVKAGLV
jgi:spermidine dehydrogenase